MSLNTGDLGELSALLNILGVPTGSGPGGDVTRQEVQQFAFNYAPVTGADDAFIVTLTPTVTSLTNGLIVSLNSGAFQNLTASPTLKVNSLAPVDIVLWAGAVAPGDIQTNSVYLFIYNADSNVFELINPSITTADTFLTQSNFYNTCVDAGAANAYVGTIVPATEASISLGFPIYMLVNVSNTNTGASTMTINGDTLPIVLMDGSALTGGEIVGSHLCWFLYSSTYDSWVLMNPTVLSQASTFVTLSDESAQLPDSFSLGSLATGLLKQTVTDGVAIISNAIDGIDFWAPGDVITLPGMPTADNDAASKAYVDFVATGLNPQAACYASSTANLTGYTYLNGTSGVGATLTAGSFGAFTQDGIAVPVGQRFLYKNDTDGSGAYNGVYIVTVAGDGSTLAVLTRAVNYDTPTDINESGIIPVQNGTINAGTMWLNVSTVVSVGVTPIMFVQFGQVAGIVGVVNGGSGLSSLTAYAPLVGGTNTTNPMQQVTTGLSTVNAPMVSQGGSAVPIFSTVPYITQINDSNGNALVTFQTVASAVNHLNFINRQTGGQPIISCLGSDTNIGMTLQTQGNGGYLFYSASTTVPFTWLTGTSYQHQTIFNFANTAATRTVNFPDASGTVQLVGQGVAPTIQKFTSGSGTYTTPTSPAPLYLRVRMVGGGGGSGGSGTSGQGNGGTGGVTSFGTTLLVCNGGLGGAGPTPQVGGTASLGTGPIGIALQGGSGTAGGTQNATSTARSQGAAGASTPFGGAGGGAFSDGVSLGFAGIPNTGSGAGGAAAGNTSNILGAASGAAGGYVDAIISTVLSSYAYAIGAGGTAGSAGANGLPGSIGGSGIIEVTEYYQ